jgi:tetratricopeptide (TPR) repeat protein
MIDEAWLESACMGHGLPEKVRALLDAAGQAWQDEPLAESLLRDAADAAPDHAAVYIARYRFYFYKNRLADALAVARECLAKAARDNALPEDWRAVEPGSLSADDFAILPRFYLFTLKGYAYLNMRLGDLEEGASALAKLQELDPADQLGGSVLRGVLERLGRDDDDD